MRKPGRERDFAALLGVVRPDHFPGLLPDSIGELHHRLERGVCLSALQHRNIRLAFAGTARKVHLAQAEGLTMPLQTRSEQYRLRKDHVVQVKNFCHACPVPGPRFSGFAAYVL
ncbi:hypothetical protein SPHV1_480025 [Novosphingobium sp. KN65.2]|nr:hypothetical protein SPHV1_480025 [Novosphingobium sp. KN65.2]